MYLMRLKDYVWNRAYPEGSNTERYIAEECLIFCSRYLKNIEIIFNRPQKNMILLKTQKFISSQLLEEFWRRLKVWFLTKNP